MGKEKEQMFLGRAHLPFDTDLAIGREGNIDFVKRFTVIFFGPWTDRVGLIYGANQKVCM